MSYTKHSKELKQLAINHYNHNGSLRQTCKIFKCNKSTLYDWIIEGINKHRKKRRPIYTNALKTFIVTYIKEHVVTTLKQLQQIIERKYKIKPSITLLFNIIKTGNITRKRLVKKYFPSKKKNIENDLLNQFYKVVKKYKHTHVICLDETAVYINMLPSYGRSERGTQAVKRTTIYPFKKFNLIVAMKYNKIIGWQLSKKSFNSSLLAEFIGNKLKTYKNHLLIFDNAVFHKSKIVLKMMDKYNIKPHYIVPYHPENNPIERLFSQLKSYLKNANCQSYEEIENTIKYTFKHNITSNNLKTYINTIYK